ncbi:ribonuclease H-like domain-containing protein, partial [Tanacetum coccineum]
PPSFIGNFKPARADLSFVGLDDFVYKSKVSETITSVPNVESTVTKTSKESLEKPKTVRICAPIIEDWESDSEDENMCDPKEVKKTVKSSLEKIEFVNVRNSTVKKPRKFSQNPRDNKRNENSFEFTKKACFVCGSFNHLIKDCDFHDKRMGNPQYALQDQGIFDSRCSRHMTGNKFYLLDYQDIDGGFVAFGGSSKGGKITGKGKIRTRKLDFEDVYFVKELKFNLFSVSQMCDKKNSVLFTQTEFPVRSINRMSYCLVVTNDFSRFSWVFFLATKDETPKILKNFITGIENQSDHKVKTVRSDNETEFKNRIMNEFYEMKVIRREFSRKPALNFMRPFRCPVTILNTLDHLGNQTNGNVGTKANIDAGQAEMSAVSGPQYVLLPFLTFESQNPKSSEDEIADDARKKNEVKDLAKEDDINGPGEATNTNSTNRLNNVSSPVNTVSSSFTTVDPGRAKDQRNEFERVFGQDKDANSTYRMFTSVSAVESSYENLGGSTPVNAATPSNADYPNDPLMPDLEDTADL